MKNHSAEVALLACLADGKCHSTETLKALLSTTQSTVGKHIKYLQGWGIDIFFIRGGGYRLSQPVNLLSKQYLAKKLPNPICLYSVIDSTNQYLWERKETLPSGMVCLTEHQKRGRGRHGKQWYASFGASLCFSIYWNLTLGTSGALGLSLILGIATIDALESVGISGVQLKWPNDIYYGGKKLAGILVEISGRPKNPADLVIGIGINLFNQRYMLTHIDQPWISLSEIPGGIKVNRNRLAEHIIRCWNQTLSGYKATGRTGLGSSTIARWYKLDGFIDRPVKLLVGEKEICGINRGINQYGAILIKTNSRIESFNSGEILLRRN